MTVLDESSSDDTGGRKCKYFIDLVLSNTNIDTEIFRPRPFRRILHRRAFKKATAIDVVMTDAKPIGSEAFAARKDKGKAKKKGIWETVMEQEVIDVKMTDAEASGSDVWGGRRTRRWRQKSINWVTAFERETVDVEMTDADFDGSKGFTRNEKGKGRARAFSEQTTFQQELIDTEMTDAEAFDSGSAFTNFAALKDALNEIDNDKEMVDVERVIWEESWGCSVYMYSYFGR